MSSNNNNNINNSSNGGFNASSNNNPASSTSSSGAASAGAGAASSSSATTGSSPSTQSISINNILNAITASHLANVAAAAAVAAATSTNTTSATNPAASSSSSSNLTTQQQQQPQQSSTTSGGASVTGTINIPLSSSLPSLSNSLNSSLSNHHHHHLSNAAAAAAASAATNRILNNIISVSSLASSSTSTSSSSSSSSSSSTSSTASSNTNTVNDKMDTSFTSNDLNHMHLSGGISAVSGQLSGGAGAVSGTGIYVGDVISRLYPNVNQSETPLPRQWSQQNKNSSLNLSHGNLRVTYKGPGKTHKDAASVRTDHSIPAAAGIYYFEIKIMSKGRDGYMGIGLSKSDVQNNRLPGWDKNSYGYHGDDGHSFCCSGTGQTYGPTFTTGDIIGCCLNLIENTCFYTKNGYNLGIAFRDLPSDLYPTVGLQTPMESVEANFGQYPFEFDIHNYVKEWHLKTKQTIENFPVRRDVENNLPTTLRKLISTYLVHHGYSSTAEAFAKDVGHVFEEELASIRNRQRVQNLVLNGQIGKAIDLTYQLFPGILERNPNLLFALKVRQFIEMVASMSSSTRRSSTLVDNSENGGVKTDDTTAMIVDSHKTTDDDSDIVENGKLKNGAENGHFTYVDEEMEMDTSPKHSSVNNTSNDTSFSKSNSKKTEPPQLKSSSETSSKSSILNTTTTTTTTQAHPDLPRVLEFGRELFQINTQQAEEQQQHQSGSGSEQNAASAKMIRDAFSLLAYNDPHTSPVGYQLDSSQREPISALLNSAILEAHNMPRIPSLEVLYGQTNECLRLMSRYGIAWCAYVNLADYMQS